MCRVGATRGRMPSWQARPSAGREQETHAFPPPVRAGSPRYRLGRKRGRPAPDPAGEKRPPRAGRALAGTLWRPGRIADRATRGEGDGLRHCGVLAEEQSVSAALKRVTGRPGGGRLPTLRGQSAGWIGGKRRPVGWAFTHRGGSEWWAIAHPTMRPREGGLVMDHGNAVPVKGGGCPTMAPAVGGCPPTWPPYASRPSQMPRRTRSTVTSRVQASMARQALVITRAGFVTR